MSEQRTPSAFSRRDCLVAVVSHDSDLERFRNAGWYRIPDRALGRSIGRTALAESNTLALYQSAGIKDGLPGSIELWGDIERIESMPRIKLLPDEPHHPAASQLYHRIQIHNVQRLERPIVSRVPRRINFLRTTRDRLLRAADLNDLVVGSTTEEKLWSALRERSSEFDRKIFTEIGGTLMEVDIGMIAGNRGIAVMLNNGSGVEESLSRTTSTSWRVIRFSPATVESDLTRCVGDILEAARSLRISVSG